MQRNAKSIRQAASAIVIAAAFALNAAALADVINVPADFPTIQQAIDAAQNGDEIIVAPGTYNEAINFNGKAIHLRSEGGPDVTTIDASGLNASVVLCTSSEGPNTILEGFTITGGTGTPAQFPPFIVHGGGMFNLFSSPTVNNCIFTGNSAQRGGGMANVVGEPTVNGSTFENNSASEFGGAMYNSDVSFPVINDSVFASNSAGSSGGAIWNSFFTTCTSILTGTLFCENAPNHVTGSLHDHGGNEFLDECPDPAPGIPGDLTGNGTVGVGDLLILLSQWGRCDDCAPDACPADLDDDCAVGVGDLLILLANWG